MRRFKQVGILLSVGSFFLYGCSSLQLHRTTNHEEASSMEDAGTDVIPAPPPEEGDTPTSDGQNSSNASATGLDVSHNVDSAVSFEGAAAAEVPAASAPVVHFTGSIHSYTVRPGDTLMKISFKLYGNLAYWKALYAANQASIRDPNDILVGTVLKFQQPVHSGHKAHRGEKYTIQRGDTLGKIAGSVYGTSTKWRLLWKQNKDLIHDPNKIFAGFYLYYTPMGQSPVIAQSDISQTGDTELRLPAAVNSSIAAPIVGSPAPVVQATPSVTNALAESAATLASLLASGTGAPSLAPVSTDVPKNVKPQAAPLVPVSPTALLSTGAIPLPSSLASVSH